MKRLLLLLSSIALVAACRTAPPPAPTAPSSIPAPAATPTPDAEAFRSTPPEPLAPRPYQFPQVTRVTLDNGLRVLVAENRSAPLVTIKALVRSGADRNADHAGLAGFVADMLDEGAGRRTAVQIAEEVGRLGGNLSTTSGWESSEVNLDVLSRNLEPGLAVFSDVLVRPTFPASEIERVRKNRLTTILQNRDNASTIADERFSALIFAGTPYAQPLIGTEPSVRQIGRSQLNDYYRRHYVPNNVSLIITGDIDSAAAVQLARKYFASWQRGTDVPQPALSPRPVGSNAVYLVDRPQAVQSEIRIGHLGARRASEDYFPLLTMNTLFGGMFTSRVNLNLREKHGYTYGARSSLPFRRHRGPFVVQAPVRNEVTLPAVQQIFSELNRIRSGDITPDELSTAKNYLMGVFPATVESARNLAGRLAEMELFDLPEDYFDTYRERIARVTATDLTRVANDLIQPDRSVVVVVGRASEIREPLTQLGYPVEVVAVEE
jgi:zinc protease